MTVYDIPKARWFYWPKRGWKLKRGQAMADCSLVRCYNKHDQDMLISGKSEAKTLVVYHQGDSWDIVEERIEQAKRSP